MLFRHAYKIPAQSSYCLNIAFPAQFHSPVKQILSLIFFLCVCFFQSPFKLCEEEKKATRSEKFLYTHCTTS